MPSSQVSEAIVCSNVHFFSLFKAALSWVAALFFVFNTGVVAAATPIQPLSEITGTDLNNLLNSGTGLSLEGVNLLPGGKFGTALDLNYSGSASTVLTQPLSSKAGTISFWVKPKRQGDTRSQTFFTLPWNSADRSYMAISYGWWEPAGSGVLYFVASNLDFTHCEKRMTLYDNAWVMVTVTWQAGANGFCRLYVNNQIAAQSSGTRLKDNRLGTKLYVGTDAGSTELRGRRATAEVDELLLLDYPLTAKQIADRYLALTGDPNAIVNAKNQEVDLILAQTPTPPPLPTVNGSPAEVRAIFDEAIVWAVSRASTDAILARVKQAGFNLYIPTVWHGGGAFFSTTRAHVHPLAQRRIDVGDDPLTYLLTQAHQMGLQVYPWFTVMKREDEKYPQFYDSGTPLGAYNVQNEGFRKFIADFIVDAAKRYPMDGVNLDYIRTMGSCVSLTCQAEYSSLYNRNLLADIKLQEAAVRVPTLFAWNSQAVGDIVTRVRTGTRAVKPKLQLVVDAVPMTFQAYAEGQDSIGWKNQDKIDLIFSMDYQDTVDVLRVNNARQALADPTGLVPLLSVYQKTAIADLLPTDLARVSQYLGDYAIVARDPKLLEKYVSLSRTIWPGSGLGLYSLYQMSDEQVTYLKSTSYQNNAVVPPR